MRLYKSLFCAVIIFPCHAAFGGTCTVRIATGNSSPFDQAAADYLGDGIADQVEIQQAFDELPPGHAVICFAAGKYSLDQQAGEIFALNLNRGDVTLSFATGAALRLSDNQIDEDEICYVLRTLGPNITIQGPGAIDGNRNNQAEPTDISTNRNPGIKVQFVPSNFTIKGGFTIRNVIGTGLRIVGGGATNITVKDLSILNCGEGLLIQTCSSVRISNLLIDNMDKQDGFEPIGVQDLVMRDSTIRNTRDSAIDVFNVHPAPTGGQNLRHTYINCTLGPLLSNSFSLAGVFEVGSKQEEFTADQITLLCSSIDMGNAYFGVVVGDFDGTATHQILNTLISGCTIDGTGSRPGAGGIGVSNWAKFTTLAANLISNCPVAVDRTLNPSDLNIRNNNGTGNTVGISPGSGANNVLMDNFLD